MRSLLKDLSTSRSNQIPCEPIQTPTPFPQEMVWSWNKRLWWSGRDEPLRGGHNGLTCASRELRCRRSAEEERDFVMFENMRRKRGQASVGLREKKSTNLIQIWLGFDIAKKQGWTICKTKYDIQIWINKCNKKYIN